MRRLPWTPCPARRAPVMSQPPPAPATRHARAHGRSLLRKLSKQYHPSVHPAKAGKHLAGQVRKVISAELARHGKARARPTAARQSADPQSACRATGSNPASKPRPEIHPHIWSHHLEVHHRPCPGLPGTYNPFGVRRTTRVRRSSPVGRLTVPSRRGCPVMNSPAPAIHLLLASKENLAQGTDPPGPECTSNAECREVRENDKS